MLFGHDISQTKKLNKDEQMYLHLGFGAISMAMRMLWRDTKRIIWCNMTVLPHWQPGWQWIKQRWKNTPTLLVILVAIAMRWSYNACIARWRRSMALWETVGCRHQHRANVCSHSINRTCPPHFLGHISSSIHWKRPRSKRIFYSLNYSLKQWNKTPMSSPPQASSLFSLAPHPLLLVGCHVCPRCSPAI